MNSCVSLVLVAAFLACSGCKLHTREYLTPPVEGIVVDLATNRAVSDATVRFGRHDVSTQSDASGRFQIDSTYRSRYVQALLPGSALDTLPVYAEHPDHGRGVAWASKLLKALNEPHTSRLLVFLFEPDTAAIPGDCQLREDDQMAYALIHALSATQPHNGPRHWADQYPEHAHSLYVALIDRIDRISRACGFSDEKTKSMLEAFEFLRTR